jgi:RNA polymerase sigma-70 factor (ECF subfamily)
VHWERVRRGDEHAIEALCEDWLPTVLQWCRRLSGPRIDPEQAAQEVFIVVLRRVHSVHHAEQLPSWMFAVTRRVLAQHRRRAWVRRWMPGEVPELAAPGRSPEAQTEQSRLAEQVAGVLDQLPEELRAVLVLCDMEDRTDPEAADLLGLKVGTAKSRLRRARARFRELCIQNGIAP